MRALSWSYPIALPTKGSFILNAKTRLKPVSRMRGNDGFLWLCSIAQCFSLLNFSASAAIFVLKLRTAQDVVFCICDRLPFDHNFHQRLEIRQSNFQCSKHPFRVSQVLSKTTSRLDSKTDKVDAQRLHHSTKSLLRSRTMPIV
jgi:hypothetical protein